MVQCVNKILVCYIRIYAVVAQVWRDWTYIILFFIPRLSRRLSRGLSRGVGPLRFRALVLDASPWRSMMISFLSSTLPPVDALIVRFVDTASKRGQRWWLLHPILFPRPLRRSADDLRSFFHRPLPCLVREPAAKTKFTYGTMKGYVWRTASSGIDPTYQNVMYSSPWSS